MNKKENSNTSDADFSFHWKFGDFEICTCREEYTDNEYRYDNDSPIRRDYPIELVKWSRSSANHDGERYCYTIAQWKRTKSDAYELHFRGGYPFEDISPEEIAVIWEQLGVAQKMLDLYALATRER